jgi:predicted transcriptional regulator
MIAFIFGIIFLALIYFYDKSNSEKKLRESSQRKSEIEKNKLKYELKKVNENNRIKDIITKIKNSEKAPITKLLERESITYTAFDSILSQMEKRDGLITTIKSGTSENHTTIKIFEKFPFQPNLEIYYEVFDIENAHFPKETLIIENIIEKSNQEILNLYFKMTERNKQKR